MSEHQHFNVHHVATAPVDHMHGNQPIHEAGQDYADKIHFHTDTDTTNMNGNGDAAAKGTIIHTVSAGKGAVGSGSHQMPHKSGQHHMGPMHSKKSHPAHHMHGKGK